MFPNHVFVGLTDAWYDPSYGLIYNGATDAARTNDAETKAIAGYFYQDRATVNNVITPKNFLYMRKSSGQNGLIAIPKPK